MGTASFCWIVDYVERYLISLPNLNRVSVAHCCQPEIPFFSLYSPYLLPSVLPVLYSSLLDPENTVSGLRSYGWRQPSPLICFTILQFSFVVQWWLALYRWSLVKSVTEHGSVCVEFNVSFKLKIWFSVVFRKIKGQSWVSNGSRRTCVAVLANLTSNTTCVHVTVRYSVVICYLYYDLKLFIQFYICYKFPELVYTIVSAFCSNMSNCGKCAKTLSSRPGKNVPKIECIECKQLFHGKCVDLTPDDIKFY